MLKSEYYLIQIYSFSKYDNDCTNFVIKINNENELQLLLKLEQASEKLFKNQTHGINAVPVYKIKFIDDKKIKNGFLIGKINKNKVAIFDSEINEVYEIPTENILETR